MAITVRAPFGLSRVFSIDANGIPAAAWARLYKLDLARNGIEPYATEFQIDLLKKMAGASFERHAFDAYIEQNCERAGRSFESVGNGQYVGRGGHFIDPTAYERAALRYFDLNHPGLTENLLDQQRAAYQALEREFFIKEAKDRAALTDLGRKIAAMRARYD